MFATKSQDLGTKREPIPPWVLHDLRRTAATGMAGLNFPPHVVDKVLNHQRHDSRRGSRLQSL